MSVKYFYQEGQFTCSLAVLRMVFDHFGIQRTEQNLLDQIIPDYGLYFKNLWNPTIAKLATEAGLKVEFHARWKLFKDELFEKAVREFQTDPKHFNYEKFEEKLSVNHPKNLDVAYRDMFKAIEKGCSVFYDSLTKNALSESLKQGKLILVTIKLDKLYPGKKKTNHSILIFKLDEDVVVYHDPKMGANLRASIDHLLDSLPTGKLYITFSS